MISSDTVLSQLQIEIWIHTYISNGQVKQVAKQKNWKRYQRSVHFLYWLVLSVNVCMYAWEIVWLYISARKRSVQKIMNIKHGSFDTKRVIWTEFQISYIGRCNTLNSSLLHSIDCGWPICLTFALQLRTLNSIWLWLKCVKLGSFR